MLELILNKSFYFSISLSILCLLLFSKNVLKFNNDDIFANNYKIHQIIRILKKSELSVIKIFIGVILGVLILKKFVSIQLNKIIV